MAHTVHFQKSVKQRSKKNILPTQKNYAKYDSKQSNDRYLGICKLNDLSFNFQTYFDDNFDFF